MFSFLALGISKYLYYERNITSNEMRELFEQSFLNSGFVEIKNVISYVQHREKFASKGRGKFFAEAVMECDEFIRKPNVS